MSHLGRSLFVFLVFAVVSVSCGAAGPLSDSAEFTDDSLLPVAPTQGAPAWAGSQLQWVDLNADGKADLAYEGLQNQFKGYLSTGTTAASPFTVFATLRHGGRQEFGRAQYADVNGDGRADLIYQGGCSAADTAAGITNCFYVSLSLSTGGWASPAIWVKHGGPFQKGRAQYADVNGDKRADLIYQGGCSAEDASKGINNCFYVSLAQSTGGFSAPALKIKQGGAFELGRAQYADINHDGLADQIFQGGCSTADASGGINNCFYVSLAQRTGGFGPASLTVKHGGAFQIGRAQYADVNNDNFIDLIYQGDCAPGGGITQCFFVSLGSSTGTLAAPKMWVGHGGGFEAGRAQLGDVDADGRADLIYQGGCSAADVAQGYRNCFYWSRSNGSSFSAPALRAKWLGLYAPGQVKLVDVTGDKRADLVAFGADRKIYVAQSNGTAFASFVVRPGTSFSADDVTRRTPAVVVLPPSVANGKGTVRLPDGNNLDVSGSATAGLQEAIRYASDFGWDMFVYGGSNPYVLNTGLAVPAQQGRTFRFDNAVLEFSSAVTGPAIVLDSMMMVNWHMTGEIRAPYASVGFLVRPVNPHPLDGALLHLAGTGMVDSEIRVGLVTVGGGRAPIRLDTSIGSIVGCVFYFKNHAATGYPAGLTGVANLRGTAFETEGEHAKTQLALPNRLDHLNPLGVVVHPPEGSLGQPARVFLPNGLELSIEGTQTAGLQEAIDLADALKVDLMIYGRGLQYKYLRLVNGEPSYPTNGFYQVNAGLVFPPLVNRTVRVFNTTLNYGGQGVAGMRFLGAQNSFFELTGQVIASKSYQNSVRFDSAADASTSGRSGAGFFDSVFQFGSTIWGSGLPSGVTPSVSTNLALATRGHDFRRNRIYVTEPNGGGYGLVIEDPQGAGVFADNFIMLNHVHDQTVMQVRVGQSVAAASKIFGNRITAYTGMSPAGAPAIGFQIWGTSNRLYANVENPPQVGTGVWFEASAQQNNLVYGANKATVPFRYAAGTVNTVTQGIRPDMQ